MHLRKKCASRNVGKTPQKTNNVNDFFSLNNRQKSQQQIKRKKKTVNVNDFFSLKKTHNKKGK